VVIQRLLAFVVPTVCPLASARALQAADAPARGITVIGYGKSSAPAETAEIQLIASRMGVTRSSS
jgi:hypothetical protein